MEITRDEVPKDPLIIVPIGSIEQHGPHLPPLGTDSIIANYVAAEVERKMRNKALLYPLIAIGSSMEHTGFVGTTWVRFESLIRYLLDFIESVSAWNPIGVVFVNGHGGNVDALNIVVKEWNYSGGVSPRAYHYYVYNRRVIDYITRYFPSFGHADAVEASLIAAIDKNLVRWDRITDIEASGNINVFRTIDVSKTGIIGSLRRDLVRPEIGFEILRFMVDDLLKQIRDIYGITINNEGNNA